MQNVAKKLGLDFSFIKAIYGKDLSNEEINDVCNHEATLKQLKRKLYPGEIGVSLSQMSIYKKMVNENIEHAVVLEDDAVVEEGIKEVLGNLKKLPLNWEIVLLGYYRHNATNTYDRLSFRQKKAITKKHKLVRFTEPMHGAHGYLINLRGAKKMLSILEKGLTLPLDLYTGDNRYINVYGVSPKCVSLDISLVSTIDEDRNKEGTNEQAALNSKNLSTLYKIKNFLRIQKREFLVLKKRFENPGQYT